MSNGIEFYNGKSQLNGQNIIGIATRKSKNIKTGPMLQCWILSAEINPLKLVMEGKDDCICGDCKFRKGVCYVDVGKGPNQIYKTWEKGLYPKINNYDFFKNELVRFGAFGDPTAIPINVWKSILGVCKGHTSYIHQWKDKRWQGYKEFSMASVDNEEEAKLAQSMGWRTFRVKAKDAKAMNNEILCPASRDDLKKPVTCSVCLLCKGTSKPKNVVENIHGITYKQKNFEKLNNRLSLQVV